LYDIYCIRKRVECQYVAIEKSVGTQLAMLMSLHIRRNSGTWHAIKRNILFWKLTRPLTKFETSVCYPILGGINTFSEGEILSYFELSCWWFVRLSLFWRVQN